MKSSILISIIFCLSSFLLFSQQSEIVYFEYDKSDLTIPTKTKLDNSIDKSRKKEIVEVKIIGHTDSDGSDEYNAGLSKRRAIAVSKYMNQQGVMKEKISIVHRGENEPVASNANDIGKQSNRRVEIEITYEFSIPSSFQVQENCYTIDPSIPNVLRLDSKGTKLHVPQNCFVDEEDRLVTDKVTICYKEYKNAAEMAFSEIPMTYKLDGEEYNFNSSGMFEIKGTANEQPVFLSKSKKMKIDYALAQQNPDISFFKLDEKKVNWKKIQDIDKIAANKQLEDTFRIEEFSEIVVPKSDRKGKAFLIDPNTLDTLFDVDQEFENDGKEIKEINRHKFPIKIARGGRGLRGGNRKNRGANGTLLAEGADIGHTYPDIIKGLNVESFGVYNCDQIYRLPDLIAIQARYVDEKGAEIKNLHVLSMMDLNYNGAFSFPPKNFQCGASGDNVLALFTKKGEIYLLDKGEFAKMGIKKGGKHTFKMKNMSDVIKSTEDLASHLGMKQ